MRNSPWFLVNFKFSSNIKRCENLRHQNSVNDPLFLSIAKYFLPHFFMIISHKLSCPTLPPPHIKVNETLQELKLHPKIKLGYVLGYFFLSIGQWWTIISPTIIPGRIIILDTSNLLIHFHIQAIPQGNPFSLTRFCYFTWEKWLWQKIPVQFLC